MTITARSFASVALTQRLVPAAMGSAGHVLLVERTRGGFALIDRLGNVTGREMGQGPVLSADIDAEGRVALLETYPRAGRWAARIRVLEPRGEERAFEAAVVDGLVFDCGTGGALMWAGDDALWLAAAMGDETGLWVGLIDARDGVVRAAGVFQDPYAESEVRLRAAADRSSCFVLVSAGQHGGWIFAAKPTGKAGELDVRQLIPGDLAYDLCVLDDGALVVLEDFDLVKRAPDGRELLRSPLAEQIEGYPGSVDVTPYGLLVWTDELSLVLVEPSSLHVIGAVPLPSVEPGNDLGATLTRDGRFASVIHRGVRPSHERTKLVLWELEDEGSSGRR